jgi:predicted glycosyltransferase
MRIVVDVNHPVHVHLFKNFIWEMQKKGHKILITASKKEVSIQLLDAYGFDYIHMGSYGFSLVKKLINVPVMDLKMYRAVKSFKPDIFVGFGSIRAAHVSKILRKPCINFISSEHGMEQYILYAPFTDAILTHPYFKRDLGKKQIRYNSYYELAYLHPNYFKPNPAVLDELGLSKDDTFIILRFISWSSTHDIGQCSIINKKEVVKKLEKYGYVFITSEGRLDKGLEKYKIKVSPEKLHDLLYYASLCMGDGAAVVSEAAVLGTPAVYVSTIVPGHLYDEEKYGLIYIFSDPKKGGSEGMKKALELLTDNNLNDDAWKRRKKLLNDKIDVTAFMVWFIESYPESFREIKENPEIQNRFVLENKNCNSR